MLLYSSPTMFPAPPATPRTLSVTFRIPRQQFTITWNEPPLSMGGTVDAYFVNTSGPDDLCGSINTLQAVTEHNYTCSGWTMPIGQKYTFTVRATSCGGGLIGPESDSVIVYLQGMFEQGSCIRVVITECLSVKQAVVQHCVL